MNNREKIIKAVSDYDVYSNNQREILKLLVKTAVNGLSAISIEYISNTTNISSANVYTNLSKLRKDGVIEKIRSPGSRLDSYQLNQEKLDYIVQLYQNKQKV